MDTSAKYIKMCELAKEIQFKWDFRPGDFVYDPAFDQVQIHLYDPPRDFSEYTWLPRQDQYVEICIAFFMKNMDMSNYEAFMRFLNWFSNCLKEVYVGKHKEADTIEEILLEHTMNMLHWKRWDKDCWTKIYEGYKKDI